MQQIKNVWTGLDRRKQAIIAMATLAMFAGVLAMSRMATSPNMTLLYAGLESAAAGQIVSALEQRGVTYEVRGGSIFVPVGQRDELRMTLASEGLPANGAKGYELLDALNGFGTTSQMFDAAYWRAKEGELARTIVASSHIRQARVHIANSGSNPFQRSIEPSASVSVTPTGAPITPDQANAIRFLVASAVAGLAIENVAVIDADGALITANDTAATVSSADDRSQMLRDRVMRLVEARVGPGNAVVEVSVDTVTDTESIRERRFDPESRVAISVDNEERTDSSTNGAGGDVTVASNLPDGDAASGDSSKATTSETRERINYEVSETEHEILRAPGAIRRLTVAVLVNGLSVADQSGGTTFQARPEEELAALRDLVASAVGFDAERGDVITLRSMDLPSAEPLGTVASASMLERLPMDVTSMVQIGALALVTLGLGLFVVRPILTKAPVPVEVAALPPAAPAPAASPSAAPALTGEIDDGPSARLGHDAGARQTGAGRSGTELAALASSSDNPVDRLRSMIGEKQEETVEILRSWLEESEETA